jgi:glycosyltransferase involved in cell wall biosynthesis/SAM-dependent methyltransferase
MVSVAILRLVTRLNIGGPARQALLLTRSLNDDYPTVLAAGQASPLEGELGDPAVPVRRVPLTRAIRPGADVASIVAIRKLMKSTDARLVHTHMAKAGAVGRVAASLMSDPPRTVHTFHGHVLDEYFSAAAQQTFVEIERWLARRTDVIVAVSPEIRDSLLDLGIGRPDQIHVLPVGLDLSPFLVVDSPSGAFRAELGLGIGTPLIGSVSRLVPIKDHLTLIRSVERLPDVHLAIIGDGELRQQLESESATRGLTGRVHFVGWRHDLTTVLADLDAVVLTSRNEGTPVALIEALAAGRPVVATDVGGVRHVVDDGRTGFLAPAGDDRAVADRIAVLLSHPALAARLARAGRADVTERFGERRLVADMRELYRSLLPARAQQHPFAPRRLPDVIVSRLRCPACGASVAQRMGQLICPCGHVTPDHDGYLDARPEQSSRATEATFRSFAYEWTRFNRIQPEDEAYWHWYFEDVNRGDLEGRVGLDAGCGKGRYSVFTARYLQALLALDGSDAVASAAVNLADCPTAAVMRADLRWAPLAPESFDFISCLGVLHHLEEPKDGFDALVRLLAPGGMLLVYLYSRPERPGVRSLALQGARMLRHVTVRLSPQALRFVSWPIALILWLTFVRFGAAIAQRWSAHGEAFPLAAYHGKPMRALWLDTFDRLSAPIEHRYVWDEVRPWYESNGLVVDQVRHDSGLFILAHRR